MSAAAQDRSELTLEQLKRCLDYNKDTGWFVWKIRAGSSDVGDLAGSADGKGYLRVNVLGNNYSQHRLAWFYVHGVWPKGCVDHKDRNPQNNRIDNLRDCSLSQNQWNREKDVSLITGLPVGVRLEKRTGKFCARIVTRGKAEHLGTFETPEAAKVAWDIADKLRLEGVF